MIPEDCTGSHAATFAFSAAVLSKLRDMPLISNDADIKIAEAPRTVAENAKLFQVVPQFEERDGSVVMTVEELTPYQNKSVILRLNDGEIAEAKVVFVFTEYDHMVVDIITTNRPDKYMAGISSAAYVIKASDLTAVDEISN